ARDQLAVAIVAIIRLGIQPIHDESHRLLLPFSYSNVSEPTLKRSVVRGYHRRQPEHEDLGISPLVSVSHRLHRRFNVIGRSHYPGRPALA
ncbi:MAG TPA: hypothetical protein VKB35_02140, partial [Ktedonobacteraceae bacterium]|nr:hypothetical protein [Ktedonobacteraceae bacterium]